jgi:hypothetical protein
MGNRRFLSSTPRSDPIVLAQGLCLSHIEQTQSLSVRDYGTSSSARWRFVSASAEAGRFFNCSMPDQERAARTAVADHLTSVQGTSIKGKSI